MNLSTFLLIGGFLLFLFITKQTFWIVVAGLLILAYFVALAGSSAKRGTRKAVDKARAVYAGEMKDIEGFTGKYPAKFFDSVGKGVAEKINDHQAPAGAKSYKDAENYRWEIKKPAEKIGDVASKILDSLGKLFSK